MEEYIRTIYIPLSKKIGTKIKHKDVPLDVKKWNKFKLRDLFDFKRGKGITKEEIDENKSSVPCIQGGEFNNGILGYMDSSFISDKKHIHITAPFLSLARVGSSGYVNIQGENSYIGDKAIALKLKTGANIYIYAFLATILNMDKYRYAYGRGVVIEEYIDGYIPLPSDTRGNPDWQFIENYIKSLPYSDLI